MEEGVPESKAALTHHPQVLTRAWVEDLVQLFLKTSKIIIFFNSLHAGASVNHIHAQAVVHTNELAIESARMLAYKGFSILDRYPAQALCFGRDSDVGTIAAIIERLHESCIPFNLIMLGERIILIPRNREHEIVSEFPGGVLATLEAAGKIMTGDRSAYERTERVHLESAFQKATLDVRALIDSYLANENLAPEGTFY